MGDTPGEMDKRQTSEMKRRISRLERALKLTQVINSELEQGPLLDIIVQAARDLTDTEAASIMLLDERTGELRFTATTTAEVKPFPVPLDCSIAGTAFTQNKPLLIADAQNDPRWYQTPVEGSGFTTRQIATVPMQVRGEVIGVVQALNKRDGSEMTWEDVEILTTLANQAAIAIQKARLLAELQAAYDALNELDQMKSDFIAIAAHELRTPLSLILGYAMFLKEDASGATEGQLDIVLQSAMQLRSLIDEMINLRVVDAGAAALELEEFPIQELITTGIEEISSIAKAKEQRISLSMPPEPIVVEADRSRMHLVLINLLSNATKYTAQGGRIGVQASRRTDAARFIVWDTGIGIPRKDFDRIFDRFYQVGSSLARRYEGMGLGLSIAKEMIELHGGHIKVESQEGKGSAFTVTIPLRQSTQK